ncbi:MAG: MOSC domain-containing protein [Novosphingobium sp.]
MLDGRVVAVASRKGHRFSKSPQLSIMLVEGRGVESDGHFGETVQHRSRRRWNPALPNLRQVHLLPLELLGELRAAGFELNPGDLGENILTQGLDLIALPRATRLGLGANAVVELTGLRNPCVQMDRFMPGLMAATLGRDAAGELIRKAGVMGIVTCGGEVVPGDAIACIQPEGVIETLRPV